MFDFVYITPEMLRLQSQSTSELLAHLSRTAARDAVLTPEFDQEFFRASQARPDWTGFFICDQGTGMVVGSGCYKSSPKDGAVEIGYGVSPDWEGKGVATALAGKLAEHAFEHGADTVIGHTLPSGLASQRVLQKAGFQSKGLHIDPDDGEVLRFERTS